MKKSTIIFLIGVIITAGAITSVLYSSVSVMEKYPLTETLFVGENIDPGSNAVGLVEINFDDDFFLAVRATPQNQQLIMTLVKEGGQVILQEPVGEMYFEKLSAIEPGWYKIDITNFGTESVSVFAMLTAHDIREEFAAFSDSAGLFFVGMMLILPGILLIIGSGAFILYKKVQGKNTSKIN